MAQKRVVVGTTPVLIANVNKARASITISMIPTAIEAGNVGRVHIGKGFPPSAILGDADQGDPLIQGTQLVDVAEFPGDPSLFLDQWWATASIVAQIIIVDEMTEISKKTSEVHGGGG